MSEKANSLFKYIYKQLLTMFSDNSNRYKKIFFLFSHVRITNMISANFKYICIFFFVFYVLKKFVYKKVFQCSKNHIDSMKRGL